MLILFRIEKGTLLTQNLILSNLEQEIKALIDKLESPRRDRRTSNRARREDKQPFLDPYVYNFYMEAFIS